MQNEVSMTVNGQVIDNFWSVRRVEKSTKKARTKGAREELDKMLGIDRSKQGKDKGKKK